MSGYVLIGDSQAQGLEPHLREYMRARGYALLGASTQPGWSTSRFVEDGIARRLVSAAPDLVLVALGGNDAAITASQQAALASDISTLVAQLRAGGTRHIIWIGPAHSMNSDVARRHRSTTALHKLIMPALDVEWHDGDPMTRDLGHTADGTHFTRTSYARWAARVNAVLFTSSSGAGRWVGAALAGAAVGMAGLAWYFLRRR